MIKLNRKYAAALLEYAKEHGLEPIYNCAKARSAGQPPSDEKANGLLEAFLELVPRAQATKILNEFISLAMTEMNRVDVQVHSVVPLTSDQMREISMRITQNTGKQLEITQVIDPSLLGGLRIVVGNTVVDDSIKRKLQDMKTAISEEVHLKHEL